MSFTLTRKTDYALVALAALATEAMRGEAPEPLSARQIAEAYDLPVHLLSNVLKDLHRAEVICSRRGAGGGYLLCRTPESIALLEVVEAIEGPVKMAMCCDDEVAVDADTPAVPAESHGDDCNCRAAEKCPITNPMQRFNDLVHQFLARITLRDLITNQTPAPLTQLTQSGVGS
ncbi:MAG: Rrf2 family transcriptional regulator [Phycisphaera sp.]|nr:Rrf2 family transcriptional regulator [Phycisphaera sp.]